MAQLSEQQREFAIAYVANGGNGTAAAVAAGYSEHSARSAAYKLTRLPQVETAIRAEQRRVLGGRLANKALAVLEAILSDENAPFGARVDAAKTLLDRGGVVAPKPGDEKDLADKPISRMTEGELIELIQRLEAERAPEQGAESVTDPEESE